MNRDDIIRMARECGLTINDTPMPGVEHFAALVAAAELRRLRALNAELVEALLDLLLWAENIHNPRAEHRINYSGMDAARAALAKAESIRARGKQ